MSNSSTTNEKIGFDQKILTALRTAAVFLAVYLCYRILAPFIPLVLWGAIIAVAIYPLHLKLAEWIGDRINTSATLITLLGSVILIAPLIILTESLVTSSMSLAEGISTGSIHVPSPPERVQEWPLVGQKFHAAWLLASENLSAALQHFGPQLEALRGSLIAIAGGIGGASLQMFGSIIIAGVFLGTADSCLAGIRSIFIGFVGERGPLLLTESETTIRSVARGVLGVAVLESILIAIGLLAAGVPAAGFLTFLVLVLAIIQVPPLISAIPLVIYALATATAFGSTVLIICSILAVGIDTFLKPVLLGRTADAPMLIILMGAIGGMLVWGVAGLFVGSVILVWCWEALDFWIVKDDATSTVPPRLPQESAESTD
jgi:predicted PurR-regulated permease PerM